MSIFDASLAKVNLGEFLDKIHEEESKLHPYDKIVDQDYKKELRKLLRSKD